MERHICTRQHWLWITVELQITGARHGEAVAREGGRYAPVRRVLGSEPLSLRTHIRRGRSRPLRSAVVEYQAPSVAVSISSVFFLYKDRLFLKVKQMMNTIKNLIIVCFE